MYTRIFPFKQDLVRIYIEGSPYEVEAGLTVAAAMMQAGYIDARKTAKRHEERGPFCFMGVCYECLVEIDGVTNCQACLTTVWEGMQVRRQNGAPDFSCGHNPSDTQKLSPKGPDGQSELQQRRQS